MENETYKTDENKPFDFETNSEVYDSHLGDVVKSFYCECTQRSLCKPISETEYECFDCGKEVKQ